MKGRPSYSLLRQIGIVAGAICVIFVCVIIYRINAILKVPDPKSSELVLKRAEAQNSLYTELKKLNDIVGYKSYGISVVDNCYNSSSLFNGGYGNRCSYKLTIFYGLDGGVQYRTVELNRKLLAAHWVHADNSDGLGLYNGVSISATMPPTRNNARLEKDKLHMRVSLMGDTPPEASVFADIQRIEHYTYGKLTFEDEQLQDLTIFQNITKDHDIVLAVSLEATYYETHL